MFIPGRHPEHYQRSDSVARPYVRWGLAGMNSAEVVGYAPLTGADGFAMPILRVEGAEGFFFQEIDELAGCRSIQRVETSPDIVFFESAEVCVRVGEPQAFIFIGRNHFALCGALPVLNAALRVHADEFFDRPDIRLQIFELIGFAKRKGCARCWCENCVGCIGGNSAKLYQKAALLRGIAAEARAGRAAAREVLQREGDLRSTWTQTET